MSQTAAIVLAAGKSTRMKSRVPKVLHEVCGRPMLSLVLDSCRTAGVDRLIVVVGYGKESVIEAFAPVGDVTWVEQKEQHGTGHAALVCEPVLEEFEGQTLVIAGDMPLIRSSTLEMLLKANRESGESVTLATSVFADPAGYGRILRDDSGQLAGIVEEADCTPQQLAINEVNISYYCFDNSRLFDSLHRIKPDNTQGEYYITDAVRILIDGGHGAGAIAAVDPSDAMGINSRSDLAVVNAVMQKRLQEDWMERGVTIVDPRSTWIESECDIGEETVIYPFSCVRRGSRIGRGCRIGPFALVTEDEPVASGGSVGSVYAVGANQP